MGSFLGHLSPGIFFIFFSIRWLLVIMSTFYNQQRKRSSDQDRVFKSSTTFPFRCCPFSNVNFEAWIKLVCCAIGIAGEFVTAFNSEWKFVNYGNSQHMVMFFFFGINGLVEIVMAEDESANRIFVSSHDNERSSLTFSRLPKGTEYFSVLLAIFIEGLLFAFHLHGRNALDIHVHTLLIISIFMTFLAVTNEWMHRNSILAVIVRSLCFLLQGTWFIQIGFILYNPLPGAVPWAEHDHRQMMLVTTLFCGHIGMNLLIASLIGYWMSKSTCASYYSSFSMSSKKKYQNVPYSELPIDVPTAE